MNPSDEGQRRYTESEINLALLDPAKWGWTARGGIGDLLPPHERSRRNSTKASFLRQSRKRERIRPTGAAAAAAVHQDVASTETNGSSLHPLVDSDDEQRPNSGLQKNSGDAPVDQRNVSFRALSSDGILNCSAYHRGHEGSELRDEETGELLCDVEATDTKHGSDGPKLIASVVIEFPLENDDGRIFKDTVRWDLSDKQTQTPIQFATDVAQDFGLSFSQTLQLAESIQEQLRSFVQESCAYAPPVALKCEVPVRPPPIVPFLYGQVTGKQNGGSWCLAKSSAVSRSFHRSSSGSILRPPGGADRVTAAEKGKTSAGNKRKRNSFNEHMTYEKEVQRRLQKFSEQEIESLWESGDKTTVQGTVASIEACCHVCRKEGSCGAFACRRPGHAYCSDHLQHLFESKGQSMPILAASACPICSLSCECSSCYKVLQALAEDLRLKCSEQCVSLEQTTFEGLFDRCQTLLVKADQRKRARQGRRIQVAERPVVPKVPVSDFPRELYNGIDIDPGSETVYSTVFTKNGSFLAQMDKLPLADKVLPGETRENGKVVEDGSVDYCNVCNQFGNLLCCDVCPRAFHRDCISMQERSIDSGDDTWECPLCRKEREGCEEDCIDGSKHAALVFVSFDDLARSISSEDTKLLKAICVVYEMLLILMEYDFGVWFRTPVNQNLVPNYSTIVAEPMDLGTVASNIINGRYRERSCTSDTPLEDALLAILKDIELVWHNCFLFNFEGSAVYRMAEVQRRKACSIRRRSFDIFLSERVKCELLEYDRQCSQKRLASSYTHEPASSPPSGPPTQSQHTITATSAGSKGRPIAAFDPDSGRIVKMYATMQSLVAVMQFFLKLKHPCEWELSAVETQAKLRSLVLKSQSDPRLRIFGYRWLFFDDLEKGKVVLAGSPVAQERRLATSEANVSGEKKPGRRTESPAEKEAIEMCVGDRCYVFGSFEEALAYADLTSVPKSTLLSELREVPSDGSFKELAGKRWRRMRSLCHSNKSGSLSEIRDVVIVKKDTLSDRVVVGFRTIDAAYEDWQRSINSSLTANIGSSSSECFHSLYLNGNGRVDGLEWKVVSPPPEPPPKTSTLEDGRAQAIPKNGVSVDKTHDENQDVPRPGEKINGQTDHRSQGLWTTNGELATVAPQEGS